MSKKELDYDNPLFFLEPLEVWGLDELVDSGDVEIPAKQLDDEES